MVRKSNRILPLRLQHGGALLALSLAGLAASQGASAQSQGEPIKAIPWTNDFSYLADPAKRTGAPWESLAYIPLGDDPGTYLSIGGEVRYTYNWWDHGRLGFSNADGVRNIAQRLRLHADLHVDDQFRAFVELGDNREFGATAPTKPNVDWLDLQQAFVDLKFKAGDGSLTFRPGRFLMPLGNGKLVGLRDGPNVRFSYDGLRVSYARNDGTRLDLFYTRPVELVADDDTFNDVSDESKRFAGAYLSHPLQSLKGATWDAYAYEYDRDSAVYSNASGKEHRRTYGTRLAGKRGGWYYDVEGALQNGHVAGQDIRAWAVLSEGGYTFAGQPLTPKLWLRFNAFSGDDKAGDNTINTFAPAAPKMPLFSDAAWFNYMNLVDLFPAVDIHPVKDLTLTLGLDFMWRQSVHDGIYYGPSLAPMANPSSDARFIGTNAHLQAEWQLTRLLSLHVVYTHLKAGEAVKDAGGVDSNFVQSWLDFRF